MGPALLATATAACASATVSSQTNVPSVVNLLPANQAPEVGTNSVQVNCPPLPGDLLYTTYVPLPLPVSAFQTNLTSASALSVISPAPPEASREAVNVMPTIPCRPLGLTLITLPITSNVLSAPAHLESRNPADPPATCSATAPVIAVVLSKASVANKQLSSSTRFSPVGVPLYQQLPLTPTSSSDDLQQTKPLNTKCASSTVASVISVLNTTDLTSSQQPAAPPIQDGEQLHQMLPGSSTWTKLQASNPKMGLLVLSTKTKAKTKRKSKTIASIFLDLANNQQMMANCTSTPVNISPVQLPLVISSAPNNSDPASMPSHSHSQVTPVGVNLTNADRNLPPTRSTPLLPVSFSPPSLVNSESELANPEALSTLATCINFASKCTTIPVQVSVPVTSSDTTPLVSKTQSVNSVSVSLPPEEIKKIYSLSDSDTDTDSLAPKKSQQMKTYMPRQNCLRKANQPQIQQGGLIDQGSLLPVPVSSTLSLTPGAPVVSLQQAHCGNPQVTNTAVSQSQGPTPGVDSKAAKWMCVYNVDDLATIDAVQLTNSGHITSPANTVPLPATLASSSVTASVSVTAPSLPVDSLSQSQTVDLQLHTNTANGRIENFDFDLLSLPRGESSSSPWVSWRQSWADDVELEVIESEVPERITRVNCKTTNALPQANSNTNSTPSSSATVHMQATPVSVPPDVQLNTSHGRSELVLWEIQESVCMEVGTQEGVRMQLLLIILQ